jgi:hypothetical protein
MNKITDFPEGVQRRIREAMEKDTKPRPSNKTANVERATGYGSLDTPKGDKADTYYRIGVFCVRKRLADYDGISAKGTIDALTHCGVWPDDNPKYIDQSPVFRQIKAGKDRSERTKIVVWKWSEA